MSQTERVTFVEIELPVCSLTYGEAPCTASLGDTGDIKCYNSRKTCQDLDNIDEQTEILRLAIPSTFLPINFTAVTNIESVSYTPSQIKLAESIGVRSTVIVNCADHPFPDTGVGGDKYREDRDFNPAETGTFWGKIKARYPFLRGAKLRWIQGNPEQNIDQMETRTFVIDRLEGPDTNGRVRIVAKDPLTVVDDQRAQAPELSRGVLATSISATDTTAILTPSGIGNEEYPTSGKVAIGGNEICTFTRSGDILTLTRGVNNTEAVAHDDGDRVQLVLEYFGESPAFIINDLLTNYGNISTDFIRLSNWQEEIDEFLARVYSGVIAEPTSVVELVNEILVQAGISIWWDELGETIRLQVLRDITKSEFIYNEDFILGDTFNQVDQPQKRVSRAQIYYGQINPLDGQRDPKNYANSLLNVSLESELNHGSPAIKQIFSRWITAIARPAADRVTKLILSRFSEPPKLFTFGLLRETVPQLPPLGSGVFVRTRFNQDQQGFPITAPCQITQVSVSDSVMTYQAEEVLISEEIEQVDPTVKVVAIDSDVNNFNLRTAFLSAYTEAEQGDTVICEIRGGVVVGSDSVNRPAFRTGTGWPAGIVPIIIIEPNARIIGRGGVGGSASATRNNTASNINVQNGQAGGLAMLLETNVEINNLGLIGGGGGGGGGAGATDSNIRRGFFDSQRAATATASGGGGGQGEISSLGGSASASAVASARASDAQAGQPGTRNAFGQGVTASASVRTRAVAGGTATSGCSARGGNGGGIGQAGSAGTASVFNLGSDPSFTQVAQGGSAGPAVNGDSLATYISLGTILGARIN
jgi:hypothetical protein